MRRLRFFATTVLLLALVGCEDELLPAGDQSAPPPPRQGVQAFVQVDNESAAPGQEVRIWVKVQLGTDAEVSLASYTGRLHFDPTTLTFSRDVQVEDGLRVVNSNQAGTGEVRFAGAAAGGFTDLTLYEGVFVVKKANYLPSLTIEMEELSGADLTDLQPDLQVSPTVFLRRAGS